MDSTPVFKYNDAIFLPDGTLLMTHPEHACRGAHCCIHNPSDHPLRDAPLAWWPGLRSMLRVCTHNLRHPDLDDFAFKVNIQRLPSYLLAIIGAHDCDNCCRWPTEDSDSQ